MDVTLQVFYPDLWGLAIVTCAVLLVALVLAATWMYRDAESRRMDSTVWVVLLSLASIFATFIGFLIVIVAYLIVREKHPIGGALPYGYGPSPGMPPMPAPCPVCRNSMMWYPQVARWYCPHCRQYR